MGRGRGQQERENVTCSFKEKSIYFFNFSDLTCSTESSYCFIYTHRNGNCCFPLGSIWVLSPTPAATCTQGPLVQCGAGRCFPCSSVTPLCAIDSRMGVCWEGNHCLLCILWYYQWILAMKPRQLGHVLQINKKPLALQLLGSASPELSGFVAGALTSDRASHYLIWEHKYFIFY